MENPSPEKDKPSVQSEIKNQTFTLLLGGLSLVAALAWNDAVRSLFAEIFPPDAGSGLWYKFLYAMVVTAIIVFVTIRLRKFLNK